jgi:hypothetical protein
VLSWKRNRPLFMIGPAKNKLSFSFFEICFEIFIKKVLTRGSCKHNTLHTTIIHGFNNTTSLFRESSLTTLVGDKIEGRYKWSAFVDGQNGFLYGVPFNARRVVTYNPLDKSLTEIGPDLGEGEMK